MTSKHLLLPKHRELFYGGAWHRPVSGAYYDVSSPGSGESLGQAADGAAADVDAAVESARKAFREWRNVPPLERARTLRQFAAIVRDNTRELATLDAIDCGNPVRAMIGDAEIAAAQIDFFAGLVTEMKGASIPMGPGRMNVSVREPLGVVARIIPFNHPFMFAAGKSAAPMAAGNTVVVKPPEQAPLSALRLAELAEDVFPPGVFNVVTGAGRETGAALVAHRGVAKVALIGSVAAGRAVMRSAADTIKPVLLELGGKNALIAFADADPAEVADAMIAGMNFAWCGQSCGSTCGGSRSRAQRSEGADPRVSSRIAGGLGDDDGGDRQSRAIRAGHVSHRDREEGGRHARVRRRSAGRAGAPRRAVHRADGVRPCDAGNDDRARGDLRPGAVRPPMDR